MKKNELEYGKKTWRELEHITCIGYQVSNVFEDFIEIALSSILSFNDNLYRSTSYEDFLAKANENRFDGIYEERYRSIISKYKENESRKPGQRPADFFKSAWIHAQREIDQTGKDVLGHLFECFLANANIGQFFTPMSVSRMLARLLNEDADDEEKKDKRGMTVHEPACGSGKIIIAQNEMSPNAHYTGIEVSPLVARICSLNMWLFDINADIYNGNTLTMELHALWRIRRGGYVYEYEVKGDEMVSTATKQEKKIVREKTLAYVA
jgi:type I restriction-modification system DNA methylase subunit